MAMANSRSGRGTSSAGPSGSVQAARPALEALLADAAGDPIRRALWLDAVDQRLRPCLSPSLAAHARLANINGNRLVFLVDSPVWHAKVRLAAPGILDAARSLGLTVNELVVKVTTRPLAGAPQGPPAARPAMATMSAAQREALQLALASLSTPDAGDE